jgi:nucleoside-diphosphate-sugar epimerase
MIHIAITGAGGYIGSVLVNEALSAGHRVTAIDRYYFDDQATSGTPFADRLRVIRSDIRELSPSHFEGVDAVVDLAALSNDPACDIDPALTEAINCLGRFNVASSARSAGVSRYVMASSCAVYGFNPDTALTEESALNPQTAYARSMIEAERRALAICNERFSVTALRQATLFGLSPCMRFDLVVNAMTRSAFETRKIIVTSGGAQFRPLLHVRDTARAFLTVLTSSPDKVRGQVFNVGFDNFRIKNLATIVRDALPEHADIEFLSQVNDVRSYSVSFAKAKRVLGFEAKLDIGHGAREVYAAILGNLVDRSERSMRAVWYRRLIEAQAIVDRLAINGRVL